MDDVKGILKRYSVDLDGKGDKVEIAADCIDTDGTTIMFIRGHEIVAEFAVWRYWKLEGERVK